MSTRFQQWLLFFSVAASLFVLLLQHFQTRNTKWYLLCSLGVFTSQARCCSLQNRITFVGFTSAAERVLMQRCQDAKATTNRTQEKRKEDWKDKQQKSDAKQIIQMLSIYRYCVSVNSALLTIHYNGWQRLKFQLAIPLTAVVELLPEFKKIIQIESFDCCVLLANNILFIFFKYLKFLEQ